MNWIDIVIVSSWVVGLFIGWRVGFLGAIFTGGGIALGATLAMKFGGQVSEIVIEFVSNSAVATIIAYGTVFILVFVVAQALRSIAKVGLKMAFLGWIDGVGSLVLGLVLAIIMSGSLVTVLAWYSFDMPELPVEQSPTVIMEIVNRSGVQDQLNQALVESDIIPIMLELRMAVPDQVLGIFPDDVNLVLDVLQLGIELETMKGQTGS